MPTTFPNSPKVMRGAIILQDSTSGRLLRTITMQFNPETLSRTLQVQSLAGESGDREEALRLTGPPVETIKLDAEIDATDQLQFPDQNRTAATLGIIPQLDALETIIYPASTQIESNRRMAESGRLEIIPMEAPLTLFVWGANRVLPVRLTDFSITEEFFDTSLNPIRAKVSLGMRVLNFNDLGFTHRGSNLFMVHHKAKERKAQLNQAADLGAGILNILR